MSVNRSDERDQPIEQWLRQSLATSRDGVTPACLDAETIAAWIDGGLSGPQLQIAQAHVADCARCQSFVATLVRSHVGAQPEPDPRRWFAWLVPITAAATAVAL